MSAYVRLKCPKCYKEEVVYDDGLGFYPDGKHQCHSCKKSFNALDNILEGCGSDPPKTKK